MASLLLAVLVAALPLRAVADEPAPAPAPRKVAVVITQAVGVGALADRLGAIAATAAAEGGASVLDPAASSLQLRAAAGPDPLTCGSDARCLDTIGEKLGVRWVLAVGIGRFGGMYGLDLRLVDRESDAAAATASGTWAEPGPDWEVALREALGQVLPVELQTPPPGRLLVRSNETGALYVDGEPAGTLPLEKPVELAPGAHAVELRGATGSARATVQVESGALAELDLAQAPDLAPGPPRWVRTGKWAAGGVAVALLAGAIATNAGASSTMDDARAQKEAGDPFAGTRRDAFDQLTVSRILYASAVAAALGTVGLFLLDSESLTRVVEPLPEP